MSSGLGKWKAMRSKELNLSREAADVYRHQG